MSCELCGVVVDSLIDVEIEGIAMSTCSACARYGKRVVVSTPKEDRPRSFRTPVRPKKEFLVVADIGRQIKQAREHRGYTQEEAASFLGIKSSELAHYESGKTRPALDLAKRIGKFYHVELIEEVERTSYSPKTNDDAELTLADIVKIRKR